MGKTKTKFIDDSKPQTEEPKKPTFAKASVGKPKDALAASLLAELNQEFGEVQKKESRVESQESKEKQDKKQPSEKKVASKQADETTKTRYRSKKYQQKIEEIDKNRKYPLNEAVELVQKSSYTKFPGTVEIHINTQVKNVRGLVSLPFVSGKKLTILAFPSTSLKTSGLIKELENMGVIIGNDETIEEISKGKIKFDVLITTPEWMAKLAKVAKNLGPRGLMPNPKNGTITDNLEKTVKELQSGKVEYKTENSAMLIHLGVGKVNQPLEEISSNVKTLYQAIGKTKIKKITLSPTMGPGIKVDLASI